MAVSAHTLKLSWVNFSTQTPSVSFLSSGGSVSLRPVLTGPDMAYISSRVAFRCIVPDSSPPVTYELIGDGGVPIAKHTVPEEDQPAPFFLKVAATSEGSYHCKATAGGNTGVSNSIKLSVVSEYKTQLLSKVLVILLKPIIPKLDLFLSSPTIHHYLTSSSSIKHQSDF